MRSMARRWKVSLGSRCISTVPPGASNRPPPQQDQAGQRFVGANTIPVCRPRYFLFISMKSLKAAGRSLPG